MIEKVRKKDGRILDYQPLKVKEQINKSVRFVGINPIEIESLIKFPKKNIITTNEIQKILISSVVNEISIEKPEYNYVAGYLSMYDLYRHVYKNTKYRLSEFEEHINYLVRNGYYRKDILEYLKNLNRTQRKKIKKYFNEIKNYDFKMTFSQVEILKSKYLIKNKKGHIEYPILSDIVNALIITKGDKNFFPVFKLIHEQYISLATPFKANLRRPNGNVGSCFIGEMGDNLASIFKSYTDMAFISKNGGGIGWYLGKVRPEGTYSDNVVRSNKINKWIKIINDIAVAVNQRGIRKGAITPAVDWWHMDIEEFLELKSELNGDLRDKSFDLFPQVVVDNYFIDKILNNEDIYLFNQYQYQKITNIDITELIEEELYKNLKKAEQFVIEGKIEGKKLKAKTLWKKMLEKWIEIGDFYITNKDNLNKSNYLKYDENGGIAKCGNLCIESFSITKLPTKWKEEVNKEQRITTETDGLYHSCNLCSINVSKMVKSSEEEFEKVCYYATYILDKSIDEGSMPVKEAENSSKLLRNIGIGVVGVGDYMAYHKQMYNTPEGKLLGKKLIEKISYYTYKSSIILAKKYGSYPLFKKENYNKLFGLDPKYLDEISPNGYKWTKIAKEIQNNGIRNFYLLALAPNTTTGILMGATASYLPVYNKEMYQTLSDLNLPILPKYIKTRFWFYKTKFQYHPKDIIEFTREIQTFIDTGISMEININPDLCKINEISNAILEGFKTRTLKGVYYSLTIEKNNKNKNKDNVCLECAN